MSFELVDAVNQQFELEKGATDLLILTKFAELVVDPANPVRRVGLERFMAMTRLDRRTLQRHLHELHQRGHLVSLDGDKIKGDRPKLYKLNLPEGFDQATVNRRRLKYYGGKPFNPVYFEENSPALPGEHSLPPVPAMGVLPEVSGNLTQIQDKLPRIQDKLSEIQDNLPRIQDRLPPYNIIREQINNNNNNGSGEVVVVDSEVEFVLKRAAAATGSVPEAFAGLGITSENAKVALEAVRHFVKLSGSGKGIGKRNPVRYLSKVIKSALESSGANLVSGSLEGRPSRGAKEELVAHAWQDFLMEGHKLNVLGKERANALWSAMARLFPLSLSMDELRSRLEAFSARFAAEASGDTTDPSALSAAISRTIAAMEEKLK